MCPLPLSLSLTRAMLARAARALRTCTRRALSSRVLGGPADAAQHPTKAAAEGGARAAPAPPAAGCTCVEHLADAAVLQSVTSKAGAASPRFPRELSC